MHWSSAERVCVNLDTLRGGIEVATSAEIAVRRSLARQPQQPLTGQVSRICSVPPAMVRQRVLRKSCTSLFSTTPAPSDSSIRNSESACRYRTPISLRALACGPGS